MNLVAQHHFRNLFTPVEWNWIIADQNCRNVIAKGSWFEAFFYCRYRLPRKIHAGTFWED